MSINNNYLSAMRDPVGYVKKTGSKIMRGINDDYAEFYSSLLDQPFIKDLLGHKIINTKISKENIDHFSLTLEHDLISPVSYPYEWPLAMLKDSARLTIELCIYLNEHDLTLKDATPWNIIFNNTKPIWVDFASIIPVDNNLLWVAYNQFFSTFLLPLLIGKYLSGNITRSMFLADQSGISPSNALRVLPFEAYIKNPWIFNKVAIPNYIIRLLSKVNLEEEIITASRKNSYSKKSRQKFFEKLLKYIESINIKSQRSAWSEYYKDLDSFFDGDLYNQKQKILYKLISSHKPSSLVDAGCNVGGV